MDRGSIYFSEADGQVVHLAGVQTASRRCTDLDTCSMGQWFRVREYNLTTLTKLLLDFLGLLVDVFCRRSLSCVS